MKYLFWTILNKLKVPEPTCMCAMMHGEECRGCWTAINKRYK